ncbi:MAG: AAA family ATPase [Sandaracinus sp.]
MLRRVEMDGFRGFRSFSAELERTTVIIGPNSSGKTSLLHAIRLACDALEIALDGPDASPRSAGTTIQVCSAASTIVVDPARLATLADYRQLFVDGGVSDGTHLTIKLTFDVGDPVAELTTRLVYSRNAQLKLDVSLKSASVTQAVAHIKPKAKGRPAKLREEIERVRPLASFVPAFYGVTRTEEYRTQPLVARMLGGGDQSHIVRNLVARLDGVALERLNGFLGRTVGASIVSRTSSQDAEKRADLAVTFKDTNGELELSAAGAGVVALVALFAALERTRLQRAAAPDRTVVFLLDEPEAHLHPRLAADVAEGIAATASEFGVQLALATHSVDVVNRLGRRDEIAVVQVDRSRSAALSLRNDAELIAALDAFCDLTPFTSLNFLASRRLILVEGSTDRRILEACARCLYQSDDARMRRFRAQVVVELEGVGNASIRGVLGKLVQPSVFATLDAQRAVRVGIALDRDWEREPLSVRRATIAPHLHAVEVVWSRYSIESLFLDPPILGAWVDAHLPAGTSSRQAVETAVLAANSDDALRDEAEDGRVKFHKRADPKTKQSLIDVEARKRARAEVRAAPAVFQHGKSRAARILEALRNGLSPGDRRHVRGSIVDVIDGAAASKVPIDAVPSEIRAFLEALTDP